MFQYEISWTMPSTHLALEGTATDKITVEEHLGMDLKQVRDRQPMDHLTGR